MSDLKIAVGGTDYITEQSTAQFAIAYAANNFTVAFSSTGIPTVGTTGIQGYICTVTTTSAHGLTFSPSANVLPNFFVTFSGTSGLSGTGILNGNVFRILSIPSTTTFTFFTTVSAATVTSASIIPVFYPLFQQALLSNPAYFTGQGTFGTTGIYPYFGTVQAANLTLGANLVAQYNPANNNVPLDFSTGVTPGTAPTMRTMLAASSGGQLRFGPYDMLVASGTTATSYISIVE